MRIEGNKVCFIDANVWLYSFIKSQNEKKTKIANSVIRDTEIVMSTQVINEVCVNLIKKADFGEEKIKKLISSFYRKYDVIEINESILLKACELRDFYSFSFWDSLIVSCALSANAEILYSEDMQNGLSVEKKLTIINPFQ
jgi:predicted nucleic acid-binding protein